MYVTVWLQEIKTQEFLLTDGPLLTLFSRVGYRRGDAAAPVSVRAHITG